MRMVDLIEKKRDGKELSKAEIDFIISGYTKGEIPDCQMSALTMAIFFQDMTQEERAHLTMAMVDIGNDVGRKTMAIISDMSQTLGFAVGNALEVKEAIDTLRGQGPKDLEDLCLVLGSHMVYLGGKAESPAVAYAQLKEVIANGKALETFKTFLVAQGGDASIR
jgi:thymidine phosphorylase